MELINFQTSDRNKISEIFCTNHSERITTCFVDSLTNSILIGFNNGRVVKANRSIINTYASGHRYLSAKLKDGFGYVSSERYKEILYLCKDKILNFKENELMRKWEAKDVFASIKEEGASGVFTSKPFFAEKDFLFWDLLFWDLSSNEDDDVRLMVRTAAQKHLLGIQDWISIDLSAQNGETSLEFLNQKHRYFQFQIRLRAKSHKSSPTFINIGVSYRSSFSSVFFTQLFNLENNINIKNGLIVANSFKPRYTEVKFGVSSEDSPDWENFKEIELNKVFNLEEKRYEDIKIGIRLITHSASNFPNVENFSFMLGGEQMGIISKG